MTAVAYKDQHTRLAALRAELARQGLDGFLVPHADRHQNEFQPPCEARLKWLTGFTGSAGAAVVLAERAALFVDGRYTLQATTETDPALYEHCHLVDHPPQDWLGAAVGAGQRIGYDPWLHTDDALTRVRTALDRHGAVLVAVDSNPLEALWQAEGRPPAPQAPLEAHPLAYAGTASADKRRAVAESLDAAGCQALVVSAPDSLAWLLNIRGGDVPYTPVALGFAVLLADATVDLFVEPGKIGPEVRAHLGPEVRPQPLAGFAMGLESLAGKRVRLDRLSAAAWIGERLRAAGAEVDLGDDPCALPRACKSPAECDGARAAHRRDGVALVRFLHWLDRQTTLDEATAAATLDALRAEGEGYRGPSFPTIAGSGPNGAIVHYRAPETGSRTLQPGDLFLIDSGGQYRDGTTDVTRTVLFGGSPTAEMRRHYTLVLKGHLALGRAVFPKGTYGHQLDTLARASLWHAGLDYDHGTGHGVGSYLGVHEGPQRVSRIGNTVALAPGMILSNEPGYYRTGAYGIRTENLVLVQPHPQPPEGAERSLLHFETLTLAPYDRRLIEASLLSPEDRAQINAYHRMVYTSLAPLLPPPDRAWLETMCRAV